MVLSLVSFMCTCVVINLCMRPFFSKDLLVDMLGVLASYSITVKELKMFFSMLRGEGGLWVSDSMVHMQLVGQKHMLFFLWYGTWEPSHWCLVLCNRLIAAWGNWHCPSSLREVVDCLVFTPFIICAAETRSQNVVCAESDAPETRPGCLLQLSRSQCSSKLLYLKLAFIGAFSLGPCRMSG